MGGTARCTKTGLLACAALVLVACGESAAPNATEAAAPAEDATERAALQQRIDTLEARLGLVTDSNAIKRLQHSYGYYLSEGMWTELADLFANDGSIEIGLDGVYRGKARIHEYLLALGDGHEGLLEGELNEHFQVMPVVTVDPSGEAAQARWRAIIMTGQLGGQAMWGEGPYANTYVKEDGVWKLASAHWYDSVMVPYETGWLETPDPTGGRFVTTLTPDAPPTVQYETWPGVHLPPFHFRDAAGVTRAAITGFAAPAPAAPPADDEIESFAALADRAALLAQQTALVEAENAVEALQRKFSFYIDDNMWSDAAALFTDDASFEWGGSGVYRGAERVKAYLAAQGPEGPQPGVLDDHMILMPVVDIAPDGLTAKGRFQGFNQRARHGEWARWESGVYETDFVNEDGVWKIAGMRYFQTMATPYEDGWGKTALPLDPPLADPAPDAPPTVDYESYPAVFVAPFNYAHPVTGAAPQTIAPDRALVADDPDTLAAQLESLERRVTALQDVEELENLNSIYGYYLAHNQWDSLADLFTEDGIIEIAMRGQYVGKPSVRRNLDLYGEQGGEQQGLLHNHMQFQPVITLAPDGMTAKIRSRALSIMGSFGTYANWMGGVYENDFTKVDGVWKIQRDQVFNTYFAAYDQGWKDLTLRPPPGITDANPPDLPPSLPFDMYPGAFLPPYHYPNPVTGAASVAPVAVAD
jgi:hypothetical protein